MKMGVSFLSLILGKFDKNVKKQIQSMFFVLPEITKGCILK